MLEALREVPVAQAVAGPPKSGGVAGPKDSGRTKARVKKKLPGSPCRYHTIGFEAPVEFDGSRS